MTDQTTAPTPLETRRTVPVIRPTEWVRYTENQAIEVARWLARRGVTAQLSFDGSGTPVLRRPASMGLETVANGEWLGVQVGHAPTLATSADDPLMRPGKYRQAHLKTQPAIDVEHLARQAAWSAETFGPGSRGGGVSDHIRKELDQEVREGQPDEDPSEWLDVIILAFDGAWRSGLTPEQIIGGVKAKQAKNEARIWPDWRTAEPGKAIEHDRSAEATR